MLVRLWISILILMSPVSALADSMIIESRGPSRATFLRGKSLTQGAKFELKKGDVLILLTEKGTRRMFGPGHFVLDGSLGPTVPAPNVVTMLNNIGARRRGVAGMRGGPGNGVGAPSRFWKVEIEKSVTLCVPSDGIPSISRPAKGTQFSLKGEKSAAAVTISFAERSGEIYWPVESVPIVDEGIYEFRPFGSNKTVMIKLKVIHIENYTVHNIAKLFAESTCDLQLRYLVEDVDIASASKN